MRTIAQLTSLAACVLLGGVARASSTYPDAMRDNLQLDYSPSCSICHQNGRTGSGTVNTEFGKHMREHGLTSGNVSALVSALDGMKQDAVDSDGDGIIDIDELIDGTDPNGGTSGSFAAPELTYGCGNSIAQRPASGRFSIPIALLGIAFVRRRRGLRQAFAGLSALLFMSQTGCYETSYVSSDVCSTGLMWTGDDEGSPIMNPGRACIDCHQREGEGPRFTFAGTVFTKSNEPDTCFGASDVAVVITGADGKSIQLQANESGNFYTTKEVALPFRAMTVKDGKQNIMTGEQFNGDCNTCHTKEGRSEAPGRILSP